MSLRLRIKYRYRLITNAAGRWQLSAWLNGAFSRALLAMILVTATVGYVFETSALSTRGFEIRALEKQTAALNQELQKLNTEVAASQSLASIQKRLQSSQLVAAANIKYLKSFSDLAVARR